MRTIISVAFSGILFLLLLFYLFYLRFKEKWANTYSGWPGPLETGCDSCYNIPPLHPRYNADKHYKPGLDKTSNYMPMKGYP